MITADQLVAHAVGDYIFQSDWMASEKTKRSAAAVVHAICYTAAFLFLTRQFWPLAAIAVMHFVIDRWRLARYIVWVKNLMGPYRSWQECASTGYPPERPAWMAVWLLIIADNTLHVLCNGAALRYLT